MPRWGDWLGEQNASAFLDLFSHLNKMKDLLKGIGGLLLGLAVIVALTSLVALFIKGGAWASAVILPFVDLFSWFTISITILVLLPLSFFKKTRPSSGFMLMMASYVFGLAAWLKGFLWAYNLWGVVGVLVGVFLFGVGVVPVGALALLLNGMWQPFFGLIATVATMYVCRKYSLYLILKSDNERKESTVIDI